MFTIDISGIKFPFLIGKVLTVLDFIEFEKETLFPFLIGKVLTVPSSTATCRLV